jgi:hypothetical protein
LDDAKDITLFSIKDGAQANVLKVKSKVLTGAGHGSKVAVLVWEMGFLSVKYFLHIYDPQMAQLQQRIAIEHAGEDNDARFVDISRDDKHVAVLTMQGRSRSFHRCSFGSHCTGWLGMYMIDPVTNAWTQQRAFQAYANCKDSHGSVKFNAVGDRIATALRGETPDSAVKVFSISDGESLCPLPCSSRSTGALLFSYTPEDFRVSNAIFLNSMPDCVFIASEQSTMRINMMDGSPLHFMGGPIGAHDCSGDAMAFSDDCTTLYVGYTSAKCVVAYSVSTLQQIWTSQMAGFVNSLSFHAGMVLVGIHKSDFTVLSAADGAVLRRLFKVDGFVMGHAVIAGMLTAISVS